MQYLTSEQIAEKTDNLDGLANKRAINKLYRNQDESHLYPINGNFDATERAIRQVRQFIHDSGCDSYGLEYCYMIEERLSSIVNNPDL